MANPKQLESILADPVQRLGLAEIMKQYDITPQDLTFVGKVGKLKRHPKVRYASSMHPSPKDPNSILGYYVYLKQPMTSEEVHKVAQRFGLDCISLEEGADYFDVHFARVIQDRKHTQPFSAGTYSLRFLQP